MTPGTSPTNSAIAPLGLRHFIDTRPYHTRSRWWVRAVLCLTAKSNAKCPLMGWSGRAPTPPVTNLTRGSKDKETPMSQNPSSATTVIGIDIGKNSFHVVGLDDRGAIILRQKWSHGQIEARVANMPPCLIGMEACVGAHHLSRKLKAFGHDARLMPAKYVRPYSKRQKNDFRDAETIAKVVPEQARPRAILSCSNSRLLINFLRRAPCKLTCAPFWSAI
jgi:Transposase